MNKSIDYVLREFEYHGVKFEKQDETTLIALRKYQIGIQKIEYVAPNLCLLYPTKETPEQHVLKLLKDRLERTEKQLRFCSIQVMFKDEKDLNPETTSKTIQQYFASKLNGLEQKL